MHTQEMSFTSAPIFGTRNRKQSEHRPRTAPDLIRASTDEPVFYPSPRSTLTDLRSQRKRQTEYVIPSPMNYEISTRLTETRSPVTLLGLSGRRSYSYWSPDSNPPVGSYNISEKNLIVRSVSIHPRTSVKRPLAKIAFQLGVDRRVIERYMTFTDNDMVQEVVDLLRKCIQNDTIHELNLPWFTYMRHSYPFISKDKAFLPDVGSYAHALLKLFSSKLDVHALYSVESPRHQHGYSFTERPKTGGFPVFVEEEDGTETPMK